jgi:hypothetical protein
MKKLLILALSLLVVGAAYLQFTRYQTKKHSPEATAVHEKNGLKVTVDYCRPYKKGRLIFGPSTDGALQPYRRYWRVGANEATSIEFNKDVLFGGKEVKAGKYNLYAFPDAMHWDVVLGSDWDRWGFAEPEASKEVVRVKAIADNHAPLMEQFLISFTEDGTLTLHWDETMVKVPITAK